jgi:hypothetical protein
MSKFFGSKKSKKNEIEGSEEETEQPKGGEGAK